MLALCLMLLGTYYAQNYAGIIGRSLLIVFWLNILMAKFRRSSHKFSESDYESDNSRILFRITLIQFSEFSKICGF